MLKLFLTIWILATTIFAADPIGCYSSVDIAESKGTDEYQSSLKCSQSCSEYAYVALKQGKYCYCLSSSPDSGNEVSSSNCQTTCQGYREETCGGSSAYDVYKGTGSEGFGSASASSSSAASSSASNPASSSSSESESESSSSAASSSSSSAESSLSSSSAESSSASSSEGPSTTKSKDSVITKTSSSGSKVIYKTVTNTKARASSKATSKSSSSSSPSEKSKHSNVGPIVGGVVGGVAGAVILGLAVFFIFKYRTNTEEDEEEFYEKGSASGSGSGLGRGGTAKSKYGTSPLDMPMTNPFVHPSDELANPSLGAPGLSDPRLNPMMGRRRISEGSLADETDYSRKILQVANPDS